MTTDTPNLTTVRPDDEALARTICHFIEGRSDDVNTEMFETVCMAIEWHRLKTGQWLPTTPTSEQSA